MRFIPRIVLIAPLAIGGCHARGAKVPAQEAGPAAVGITLIPVEPHILENGTQYFAVINRLNDSSLSRAYDVTYTVSAGTITPGGLYRAPAEPGTYQIRATTPDGFTDIATIRVSPEKELTGIDISDPPAVAAGRHYPFGTVGRLASGASVAPKVTWTASGGTISPTGVYTAGLDPGQYAIVARSATGGFADTATLTVHAAGVSLNEPAGFTSFAIHNFSSIPSTPLPSPAGILGAWWAVSNDPDLSILTPDVSAPESPPNVIVTRFPAGLSAGTAPVTFGGWDLQGAQLGQKSKVYVSVWIMIAGTDFENHPAGTRLGSFGFGKAPGSGSSASFVLSSGTGPAVGSSFVIRFSQPGATIASRSQNTNPAPLMTVGTWHHLEALLQRNTLGVSDGMLRVWIDAQMVMDYSNVEYLTPAGPNGFYEWTWQPVWGGTGTPRTRDDFIRMDHIYLSGIP